MAKKKYGSDSGNDALERYLRGRSSSGGSGGKAGRETPPSSVIKPAGTGSVPAAPSAQPTAAGTSGGNDALERYLRGRGGSGGSGQSQTGAAAGKTDAIADSLAQMDRQRQEREWQAREAALNAVLQGKNMLRSVTGLLRGKDPAAEAQEAGTQAIRQNMLYQAMAEDAAKTGNQQLYLHALEGAGKATSQAGDVYRQQRNSGKTAIPGAAQGLLSAREQASAGREYQDRTPFDRDSGLQARAYEAASRWAPVAQMFGDQAGLAQDVATMNRAAANVSRNNAEEQERYYREHPAERIAQSMTAEEIEGTIGRLSRPATQAETDAYTAGLDALNAENVGLFPDENDPKVRAARQQYREAAGAYSGSKDRKETLQLYRDALQIRIYQDRTIRSDEIAAEARQDPRFEAYSRVSADFAKKYLDPKFTVLLYKQGTEDVEKMQLTYSAMTNEEKAVFNYLWNKNREQTAAGEADPNAANPAISYMNGLPGIEERYWKAYAERYYIPQSWESLGQQGAKVINYIVSSLALGTENALNWDMVQKGYHSDKETGLQAGGQYGGTLLRTVGGAAQSTGQMLPAMMAGNMAASFVGQFPTAFAALEQGTQGAVTAERVVRGAKDTVFFLSSKGSAKRDALEKGLSEDEAEAYSILSGLSEVFLQNAIGGIASFGGIGEQEIMQRIAGINNAFLRTAAYGGVKYLGELTEEELQNWLDPFFITILTGNKFEAPTAQEMLETALSTFFMVGSMEAGNVVSYYDSARIRSSLQQLSDYSKSLGGEYSYVARELDSWIRAFDEDPDGVRFTQQDLMDATGLVALAEAEMEARGVKPEQIRDMAKAKAGEESSAAEGAGVPAQTPQAEGVGAQIDRAAGETGTGEEQVPQTVSPAETGVTGPSVSASPAIRTTEQTGMQNASAEMEAIERKAETDALQEARTMSEEELRSRVRDFREALREVDDPEFQAKARGFIKGYETTLNLYALARGDDLGLADGLGRVGVETGETRPSASASPALRTTTGEGRGDQMIDATGDGGQVDRDVNQEMAAGVSGHYGEQGGLNDGRGDQLAAAAGAADGGERNGGLGAGRPAGGLGEGAGGSERGGARKAELAQIRAYLKALGNERRSARDVGVRDGTGNARNVLLEGEALSDGMRELRAKAEQAGVRLDFVTGAIETKTASGTKKSGGVFQVDRDGTPHIFVQADSMKRTPEQLYRHEYYHSVVAGNRALWQQIVDYLNEQYTQEEIASIVGAYVEAYDGCYGYEEADLEKYLEEIFADVYAEMDRGGGRERAAREAVLPTAQRFAGDIENARQNRAGIDSRNGPGTRLAYAGQNAETADIEALNEAQQRIEAGEDAETVRRETGWFRGMDGKWRFEIDDSGMEYRHQGDMQSMRDPEYREYLELWDKVVARLEGTEAEMERLRELDKRFSGVGRVAAYKLNNGSATLRDIIRHDALFQAYPGLRDVHVQFAYLNPGDNAYYDEKTNTIKVSYELKGQPEGTLIHEIQHAIQGIEGFAKGSNMGYWENRLKAEGARDVSDAEAEVRRLFDAMPEEVQGEVRRFNQANSDRNYDLASQIEEQLYLRGYGDMFSEYMDAVTFLDLERRRQRNQDYKAGSADLYFRTAGEVEARDAASRRELSAEHRKNTRPDVDRRDVVFAGQGAGQGEMQDRSGKKKNNTKQSATSPLTGRLSHGKGSIGTVNQVTAAAELFGITDSITDADDAVKSALVTLKEFHKAIQEDRPLDGMPKKVTADTLLGYLCKKNLLTRQGGQSAYRIDGNHTLRMSDHSANSSNFLTPDNLSIVLKAPGKLNNFYDAPGKNVVEVVFSKKYLNENPKALQALIADIGNYIATGEYRDSVPGRNYNTSGNVSDILVNGKTWQQMNDDYIAAVNRGDTETAQRMVDEAAKRAGYTIKAYHGTRAGEFYVFDRSRIGANYGGYNASGGGFDFTTNEFFARLWGQKAKDSGSVRVMPVYLKAEKTFYAYEGAVPDEMRSALPDDLQIMDQETGEVFTGEEAKDMAMRRGAAFQDALEENGIDFVETLRRFGYDSYAMNQDDGNIAVYDEDQIKSAEPVTRDKDGKVIPLSERFRTDRSGTEAWKNNDIRYSPSEDEDGIDWAGNREEDEESTSSALRAPSPQGEGSGGQVARATGEGGETDSSPAAQNDDYEGLAREKKAALAEKVGIDGLKSRIKTAEERLKMWKAMASSGYVASGRQTELRQRMADTQETLDILREELQRKKAARKAEKEDAGKKAEARAERKRKKAADKKEAQLAADKPKQARKEFREGALDLFGVPAGKRQTLGKILNDFADRMLEQGSISNADRAELFRQLYEAGSDIIPADEIHESVRDFVKHGRIYVPDSVRADFGDDWGDFQRRAWGNGIYLTHNQNDRGIDSWQTELAEMWPGSFDAEELDARTMLENLVDLAEAGQSERVSIGEMMRHNYEQTGWTVDQQMDELEQKVDRLIDTFAQKAALEMKVRTEGAMKLIRERKRNRETVERQQQRRRESETRNEVMKQLQQLSKMRKKSDPVIRAKIDEIIGNLDIMARQISPQGLENLQELARRYSEASEDPNFLGNPYVEQRLARLGQVQLDDLDISEVIELGRTISALVKTVTEDRRLLTDARNREISDAAGAVSREIKGSAGSKGGKLRSFVGAEHLSPTRMLQRIGGWVRGGMMEQLSRALEDGGTKRMDYQRRATRIFDKFTQDKANQKWLQKAQGKHAEWIEITAPVGITDENGTVQIENRTFEITPMMRVGLLMHSRNVDNLRHIWTGGIVIPDKGYYIKGDLANADSKGLRVKLRPEVVRAIVADCTEQERAFATLLEQYYDGFSKDRINEVSMMIDGFERAGGDHYYGIKVSRKFLATQPEQVQKDMALESIGSIVNERVHAGNPIILEDASKALTDHIDLISKYYGFTIPIRDFNAVMNYTFHEAGEGGAYAGSIKEILQDQWGSEAQGYIDKLLADLQQSSGVTDQTAQVLAKLRGNLAGASLMLNPAVALSQTASLPGAMQTLGADALIAGLKPQKVDMGLVEKYSPLLWYRNQGNSTQELGDYMKQKGLEGKLPWFFNWIQKMDSWTIRRLWAASEYRVRKDTDLSPGSQEQIDAGEDLFYQEVARVFQRAVYDTQPNYSEMQRPAILRTESDMVKFLTMYKTVPLQYYNMMYEAAGRLKADSERYRQSQTKENREQLKQSRSFAAKTFAGVLGANVVYVCMKAAIKGILGGKKDKYLDEEGDVDWGKTGLSLLKDLGETYAGSMIFGSELLNGIEKFYSAAATGSYSRYGGMEISALSAVEDTLGELYNLASKLHKEDFRGGMDAVRGLAKQLAMNLGFPANNLETYLLGTAKWFAPEWVDRYENFFDEFERADLGGKHGEELGAAIRVLMDNRTEGLDDETIGELQRLWESGQNMQIPSGIPEKATVEGEEIQIRGKDRDAYRETWGQVVQDSLKAVIGSEAYEDLDDAGKAQMIKKLYDFAAQQAAAQVTGKEPDNWVEFGKACEDAGIQLEDYLAVASVSKDKLKDMDGEELATAIRNRMQFRAGDLDAETLDELGRLYAGGETGVIPSDVPTSITINSQEISLTPAQRVSWLQAWQRTTSESLEALMAGDAYKAADDAGKAQLIGAVYDVARAAANGTVSENYSPDKWISVGQEAEEHGISMADYIPFYKQLSGLKTAEKLDLLKKSKWSSDQKEFLWSKLMASDTQLSKYQNLKNAGVKWADALDLMDVGESPSSSGMTEEQQARYQKYWDEISGPATQRLLNNSAYKKANQATREAYLDRLNDYAARIAKAKVISGYDKGKWVEEGERLTSAGVKLDEYIVYYSGISDANAKSKYEALNKTGWSEKQKLIAMEYISASTCSAAKVGQTYQVPLSLYLDGLVKADANGNGSISQEEAEGYLEGLGSSVGREDKAYLWQMLCLSSKWKKNPYSTTWGQEIWESLHPEG